MQSNFITLSLSLEVIRALRDVIATLKKADKSLAEQVQRAAASAALNLAEGAKRIGKDQMHLYRIASGSAAEVRTALQVAQAFGHLDKLDLSALEELLDRQAALLYRLTVARR
jgi:four helix bundle protein